MQSVGKESGKEVLLLVLLVASPLDFVLTDTSCALAVFRLVGCHYCICLDREKLSTMQQQEVKSHEFLRKLYAMSQPEF